MPVDKSDRRIREMFGEISPRYDFLNHFLSGGTDFYWRWQCVRSAPVENELPILDVCTGTGDLAIAFSGGTTLEIRLRIINCSPISRSDLR